MGRVDYWHKAYTCPYYQTNDVKALGCQLGYLTFPDKISALELMDGYCASDWEKCPLAQILNRYEERMHQEDEFRKRQIKRQNRRINSKT